ncbi:pancreatic triacylglycerol lipase-like isoform X2 [Stegodyphus dumicola]|nr:pancreatic triacylglycerol lipase-like isoform X2 [Stegodyphus dumicola]
MYDDNIILLDLFPYPSYSQFATNTRVLAAQITQLIRFIEKAYGYPPEKFYLLGHSFGAHTAGYIGKRIPNIGRITGMDPAGPLFQYTDNVVKLESSDAPFVDNIHTNPGLTIFDGLGTFEDTGHVDFWPDNAHSRGCSLTLLRIVLTGRIIPDFIENLPYCRHFRATEFMIFSFGQNGCYFVGVECRSWDSFLEGQCNCGSRGERCRFMGVFSTPAPHKTRYYLRTGFERPYCLHQYQIIVFFELLSEQMTYESVEIVLDLLLEGETKIQEKVKLNINLIVKKQVHHLLVTSKSPLGRPTVAAATLYRPINIKTIKHNTRTEFGAVVEAIEINYLFPSPKEETSTLLC